MVKKPRFLSLYFHIPFCTKKCAYCHFYVIPDKDPFKKQLMKGFFLEWEKVLPLIKEYEIFSIYFGGGTPSLIGPEAIFQIISLIRSSFDLNLQEITLEANPENITLDLMCAYFQAGINRVSIGVQTLDNSQLLLLGRIHDSKKAISSIEIANKAGFKNISIDLMYDLPNQSLTSWQNTLSLIKDLPITHLSLYNLTIEPHTAFFKIRDKILKDMPNETLSLEMYKCAIEQLTSFGFKHYEISAFAKENNVSQHNIGYWLARPFWGFGPSAFSYFNKKRFRNIANLNRYLTALEKEISPIDFEETLSPKESLRELLAINLRMIEGVNLFQFEKEHGELELETKTLLKQLINENLLILENDTLRLSEKGLYLYDSIATEII